MLLAIDVGNTHTVLGLFDGPDLVEHWRIATEAHRTADEIAVVLRGLLAQHEEVAQGTDATVDGIALCSTVPSVLHEMREVCVRYYGDVPAVVVEVECDTLDQVAEAKAAGAALVLVDNMTPEDVARAVGIAGGALPVEVSGRVTLDAVAAYAAAGADLISVGALTHSAPVLDIGLDLE